MKDRRVLDALYGVQSFPGASVGVEIELEGDSFPLVPPYGWKSENEGSLRGNCIEYILSAPVEYGDLPKSLMDLQKAFDNQGTELYDTPRAGTHVHINVQQLTFSQAYKFIMLYLVLEDMLIEYCGPTRKGNLFCLRAQDAEGLIFLLMESVRKNYDYIPFVDNHDDEYPEDRARYASVNVQSLWKFGSVEFRALKGTWQPEVLHQWVGILLAVLEASLTFKEPSDIAESFSLVGPVAFVEKVLGDYAAQFNSDLVLQGLRRVQPLLYTEVEQRYIDYPGLSSEEACAQREKRFRRRENMVGRIPKPMMHKIIVDDPVLDDPGELEWAAVPEPEEFDDEEIGEFGVAQVDNLMVKGPALDRLEDRMNALRRYLDEQDPQEDG
jgi:hypothetical protein